MPEPTGKAVFLSYASQDVAAALRICDSLRSGGVEVWFDADGGLEHGDEWDAKIRRQIKECVLFIPVISASTQARHEGYFRIEWELAAERAMGFASGVPFILPVVIDDTREPDALVPDRFRKVQWTKIPEGNVPAEVQQRFLKLWSHRTGVLKQQAQEVARAFEPVSEGHGQDARATPKVGRRVSAAAWVIASLALAVGGYFWMKRPAESAPTSAQQGGAGPRPPTTEKSASAPPNSAPAAAADPKSIAVLPFENLSTEPDSELFANGMHEEMLTALGKVAALNVIGRTSVLPYRDAARRNLPQISTELGVGSVVEGSVRRAGQRVRISVQLVDARTRRQLWADSYERDFTDVFAIQAAVAQEVAGKLSAKLTPREQRALAQRPSENARAYELYVEAKSMFGDTSSSNRRAKYDEMVRKLEEATRLDPQFAGAFAQLAYTHATMFFFAAIDSTPARAALAQRAVAEAQRLAPDSGATHVAAGYFAYACLADYPAALRSFEAALLTNPNDNTVRFTLGLVLRRLGRPVEAAAELERSVALDPLDSRTYGNLIQSLMTLRRYAEVVAHAERRERLREAKSRLSPLLIRARFELDGDRTRFVQGWKELAADADDESKPDLLADAEIVAGNFAEALRVLSDPRIEARLQGAALLDHLLQRAQLAHVLGRVDEVAALALRALASMGAARGVRFGENRVIRAEMALAAMAGRKTEALEAMGRLREATKNDQFIEVGATLNIATAHLLLGDEAEALEGLTSVMTRPSPETVGPRSIRLHPVWSKLNGNPRFEAILQQAKPL